MDSGLRDQAFEEEGGAEVKSDSHVNVFIVFLAQFFEIKIK